jgi:hypothetical protein
VSISNLNGIDIDLEMQQLRLKTQRCITLRDVTDAIHNLAHGVSFQHHRTTDSTTGEPTAPGSIIKHTRTMTKNTIPTGFSHTNNLLPILNELDTQADAVLAIVLVLQGLHRKYANSSDPEERKEYAVVLLAHGEALETDLGIIRLDAGLITDARLEAWVNSAADDAEKKARKDKLDKLAGKMADVEEVMAELKEGFVGDTGSFL